MEIKLDDTVLAHFVRDCKAGEEFYIGTDKYTPSAIDLLRYYIKSGVIYPSRQAVEERFWNQKDFDLVYRGDVIYPKMKYLKHSTDDIEMRNVELQHKVEELEAKLWQYEERG